MTNWIPLSTTTHATKHYIPRKDYSFAADQQVVPILIEEIPKLLPHFNLCFIYEQNTYHPVVLTSLGGNTNLYINHDGKWLAPYIPAYLRTHPFRMITSEDNKNLMCILDDYLTDQSNGLPIFDEQGNLTQPVQDIFDFLHKCDRSLQATKSACALLDKAGVIEKWPLQIQQQEGQEPLKINGLYKISEKALNELDGKTFAGLRGNGALALAYAQIFSMNQINQLTELSKYHARLKATQQQKANINPEEIFGDDDKISFDNI